MICTSKSGDWQRALSALQTAKAGAGVALKQAVAQEAHLLRRFIVQGITRQAPGGAPLSPIAALTRAARRLRGFGGTKALMVRGDLRNSVAVVTKGDVAFVGVLRRARGRDGSHLVDLAEVHEFGAGPTILPITPAMRRYLGVLLRQAGVEPQNRSGGRKGFVLLVTPPRPFLRPAGELFKKGLQTRFARRVGHALGWVDL